MFTIDRILLLGAAGYIGGTVLDHLIINQEPTIKALTFDLLVRNDRAAERLSKVDGDRVNPIIWKGFTDTQFVADIAANHDIILNTGTGFVADGAKALVNGLAQRVKPGSPAPWILHLSGCSNFTDRPLTQTAHPTREWDSSNARAAYDFLEAIDKSDPYPQRTAEVAVLAAAEDTGFQAVSLNAPCIFGKGTGLFNQTGFIIPTFMRCVVRHGYGFKLNDTAAFDRVHVEDLADLFVLVVQTILG